MTAAVWLFGAQQWLAGRMVDLQLRRLRRQFERIEKERGSEEALDWMEGRVGSIAAAGETNLFGERTAS